MCKIIPRIKEIAASEGITIGTMERTIGASKGVLYRAINNGTDIQAKWLAAIVENYPQYSEEWLLTGKGGKLKQTCHEIDNTAIPVETRPRIPLEASAGTLSLIIRSITEADCDQLPVITRLPKYDFTIVVKGDSMEPEFHSGDEVACRFVEKQSFIQWGRPHIIDTSQGVILKRIYNRHDAILCKSNNKEYEDFEIPKNEVYRMAIVVGFIRLY